MTTPNPSERRPNRRSLERRQADKALHQCEERLSFALEAGRLGLWELDLLDHTIYRSLDHDRIFGYESPLPEWTYEMFLDHVVPEDRSMVDEKFQAAVASRGDWNFDYRIRRTDGEIRWLWATGGHRPSNAGRQRMAGLVEDITERKQVEAGLEEARIELVAIKKSEDEALEFAESVINTVREPLLSLDKDLRVVTVSRSFYDFFKVKPEDTVGHLIYDLGNKQWDIPRLRELLETILPQRTSFDDYEVEHEFVDIGQRTMLLNARQIQQGKGKERVILLAIEDITERKEIEAGLEKTRKELAATKLAEDEAREYAESVINTVREPLLALDQDLRVVKVSRSFYEFFKVEAEDTLGQLIYDLGNKQWDIPKLRELLGTILPQQTTFDDYEVEHEFATIGKRTMLLNARQIEQGMGKERIILLAIEDITERKKIDDALGERDEQLRQSQKMEAVGQLAGGIAHDFNNLLTTILGYSEMILASEAPSFDEVRPDVEEIKHAAERAGALTKQILAFSRRQTLRPEVVSLNTVVCGMEPFFRSTIGENIDLVILGSPELAPVEVDPHQFEQVLMNLVLNARDAMPSGGQLTIETADAELGQKFCRTHVGASPGNQTMLRVSDTGVGMNEATKERVFEPFFTTKAIGAGTGLGLAMVYGIVKQSGGSIFVDSEPGKGTTFKIYLPRSVQSRTSEEIIVPPRDPALGSEIILVVEDEVALRSLAERILGGAGYTVLTCGSAAEALEALGRGECSIDLLLTDVMLPGALQGHDLARVVLAARPDLPILFMSGYSRDALAHAGRLDAGVNLLEKPFTPEALTGMVRQVLDQP